MNERPTTLYRAFDSCGRLLYVGIAYDWGNRWSQHRAGSHWFGEVVRIELEEHPTRRAAAIAEAEAVANEHPLHNVEHTARDTRPWRQRKDKAELHVTPFDHIGALHGAPAYQKAYAAIDAFANARLGLRSQEALVQVLAEMARAVPYGDACPKCDGIAYPVRVQVADPSLTAWYSHCGRAWKCYWAIDAPLMGP